jgi:hypothetical protein
MYVLSMIIDFKLDNILFLFQIYGNEVDLKYKNLQIAPIGT